MLRAEPMLGARYQIAVEAVASNVFAEIVGRGAKDDAVERALVALRRIERAHASEHSWIFHEPSVLFVSDNVVEALELRPDGRREWLHAHLASAVAAVARFDVMAHVVERMGSALEESEGLGSAEAGEA